MIRKTLKSSLLLGAVLAGTLAAAPALAQDASDAANSDDIIVTARRTEECLQDSPISIAGTRAALGTRKHAAGS